MTNDSGFQVSGLRWWIAGLVFLATVINFLDRQTIAVLGPVISAELHLNNVEFASITTWFLVAYTVSQGLSGKLYDRVGTRRGFIISIVIWSGAAMAHAFARGLASLSAFRFVLGLGEAGNWPGAAKVIAEWFPARERALGMGIFNSGVCVGSIIAPPLIIWMQINYGWQTTFLTTGALGFGWLILWIFFYQTPDRHPWLTSEEHQIIRDGSPAVAASHAPGVAPRWRELLRHRQVWGIVLSRFLTDPVWWLYITWLPLYLYNVRGFNLKEIGQFAWLPFVTADAGSLLGGWTSGYLIGRGWSPNAARKTVIVVATIFMTAGIPAALATDAMVALGFVCTVTFGFQAWINNVQTLPSDYFPSSSVASITGLGGFGAGLGAILFTMTTGWVVDHYSYTPILVAAAVLPIAGTTALFAVGGRVDA